MFACACDGPTVVRNSHVVLAVVAGAPPAPADAVPPTLPLPRADPSKPFPKPTLKAIFDKEGPAAFAKAVRKHEYDDAVKLRRCVLVAGGGWMGRQADSHLAPHVLLPFLLCIRGLLLMDTTWRDAHQSLLATRVRTRDILDIGMCSRWWRAKCVYSWA